MKQWQVLRTVFPEVITENFEFTDYVEEADRLEYWLDEREYMGSVRKPGCIPSPVSNITRTIWIV